jgi:DNA primase
VAELLRIEESGMNALVNKIIRDKITKEENKPFGNYADTNLETNNQEDTIVDTPEALLLNKDELNERALVRCLIEFGHLEWTPEQKVADYLLQQIEENDLDGLMENPTLQQVVQLYIEWYKAGKAPDEKTYLYLENRQVSELVIQLMSNDTEISPNWKEKYEAHIPTRAELFREEVISCLNYLKLRKIKRMIIENQQELMNSTDPDDQMVILRTHSHLKAVEIELTKDLGTVIYR